MDGPQTTEINLAKSDQFRGSVGDQQPHFTGWRGTSPGLATIVYVGLTSDWLA